MARTSTFEHGQQPTVARSGNPACHLFCRWSCFGTENSLSHNVYSYLPATIAELSSCDRDWSLNYWLCSLADKLVCSPALIHTRKHLLLRQENVKVNSFNLLTQHLLHSLQLFLFPPGPAQVQERKVPPFLVKTNLSILGRDELEPGIHIFPKYSSLRMRSMPLLNAPKSILCTLHIFFVASPPSISHYTDLG